MFNQTLKPERWCVSQMVNQTSGCCNNNIRITTKNFFLDFQIKTTNLNTQFQLIMNEKKTFFTIIPRDQFRCL